MEEGVAEALVLNALSGTVSSNSSTMFSLADDRRIDVHPAAAFFASARKFVETPVMSSALHPRRTTSAPPSRVQRSIRPARVSLRPQAAISADCGVPDALSIPTFHASRCLLGRTTRSIPHYTRPARWAGRIVRHSILIPPRYPWKVPATRLSRPRCRRAAAEPGTNVRYSSADCRALRQCAKLDDIEAAPGYFRACVAVGTRQPFAAPSPPGSLAFLWRVIAALEAFPHPCRRIPRFAHFEAASASSTMRRCHPRTQQKCQSFALGVRARKRSANYVPILTTDRRTSHK